MLEITNIEVTGWEAAVRGMRNPMNSWDKSDSGICGGNNHIGCAHCALGGSAEKEHKYLELNVLTGGTLKPCNKRDFDGSFQVGKNDLELMERLVKAGTDHSKFMRMITVTFDVEAPLYWWKEMDTYKVGTVRNSCSTMHKIMSKPFALSDFSTDHLSSMGRKTLNQTLAYMNTVRDCYLEEKDAKVKKDLWWDIIQLLPSSYNQKATLQMNYAVLRNIYRSRLNHKLDEWHEFCRFITVLPHSALITAA